VRASRRGSPSTETGEVYSPPLWDVVAARLDEANRQQDAVAPMLEILDKVRERVDDETWGLIVDFEWHSSREVVTGIEIGLESTVARTTHISVSTVGCSACATSCAGSGSPAVGCEQHAALRIVEPPHPLAAPTLHAASRPRIDLDVTYGQHTHRRAAMCPATPLLEGLRIAIAL
jgi:hypothetical protein